MKSEALPLPSRLKPALPALGVASLLAAGTNAYGQVVFTAVNGGSGTSITGTSYNLSLPVGFNTPVLTLIASDGEGSYGRLRFTGNNLNNQPVGSGILVSMLAASTVIDGSSSFASSAYVTIWRGNTTTDWGAGTDTGAQRGYVGFKFVSNLGSQPTLFGWMDIGINRLQNPTITLYGYAYEATPGVSITTPAAIPEPSAAALVIGAASLLALRQRRRKAA